MENNLNTQPSGTPQQFSGEQCRFGHFRRHWWSPYPVAKDDIYKYHGDPEYLGYHQNNCYDFPPHHFRGHKFRKHHGCHKGHYQNPESFHWNRRHCFMENNSKEDKMKFILSQPGGEDFLKKRQEFQNSWMAYRVQMSQNVLSNQSNQLPTSNQPPTQK